MRPDLDETNDNNGIEFLSEIEQKLKTLKQQSSKLSELRKQGGAKSQKVLDFRKPRDDIEEFKMANGKLA